MAIKLVVAVTDTDWFSLLRQQTLLKEVNFWAPSDKSFKALQPGELFLFKLHAPVNKIVGGVRLRVREQSSPQLGMGVVRHRQRRHDAHRNAQANRQVPTRRPG